MLVLKLMVIKYIEFNAYTSWVIKAHTVHFPVRIIGTRRNRIVNFYAACFLCPFGEISKI